MNLLSPELLSLQHVVAGRYSIIREIGRGGMGIVALAREVSLERPVAIKLLPPDLAAMPDHRARFVREARTAAALSHPNIVAIHSVEEHDEIVFFAMAFVDGETVADRVSRAGPLSGDQALRLMQEVAWALGHAHARGVIHRDVKPDNILLERASGRAMVTDFGIARVDGGVATTGEGTIIGTPRYMSPEQANGERVDGRSDVYSLGAVAYFALTGRPPLDGASTAAILAKHAMVTPDPVASVRPGLAPRFADAVDRCLAKDPAARWPSAEELAAALNSTGARANEIAPIVRGYVREADAAGSEIATALTAALAALFMLALSIARPSDGFWEGLSKAFEYSLYLSITASMVGLAGLRLGQLLARARHLIRAGYGHSAVKPALIAHDADRREEETQRPVNGLTPGGVALRVGAAAASIWLSTVSSSPLALIGIAGSIVIPTMTVRQLWARVQGRQNWWQRLLRGPLGERMFRVAGIGVERPASLPTAGEPTALALGHTVADLFHALPPAERARFPELPALVSRLEDAAAKLRARTPAAGIDERTHTVVAALELLRLDLLKLHAERGSPDDLTRDLDAAKRIGDDIAAQLAGRAEVDRLARRDLSPAAGSGGS